MRKREAQTCKIGGVLKVTNGQIAAIFYKMADLLEIEGANAFRVRAYRGAADSIERLPNNLAAMHAEGQSLTSIKGVGPEIARKIEEIIETGQLSQLEELQRRTPPEMIHLLKVDGLGPRRVQVLYQELGIKNIKQLHDAAAGGKIRELPGFGEKIERAVLANLKKNEGFEHRFRIDKAEAVASALLEHLRQSGNVSLVEVAGSFRRRKETVGDLDILAISPSGGEVIDHFTQFGGIREVVNQGETRSTVILSSGLQVDLRVVPSQNYGAALLYFTGSKPHQLQLRLMAIDRGWKLNEYGLFAGEELIAGETEESIYTALDLVWVPPELRENTGEIEAAAKNRLPLLIALEDIRGDLQAHTRASDGKDTLETMATQARALGYEYLAVTDHSRSLRIAGGLQVEELHQQIEAIDRINERYDDFRLLKSCEVDILADGTLDMPDEILARLDLCVCAIHSNFKRSREQQTERVLRAMENPYFHIFAHPTGRLLEKRPGYDIDLDEIVKGAKERGCFLEINAHPERLDLNDSAARLAKEGGVKVAISTDAHSIRELHYMRFGIDQARRGWLGPDDVLNTRSWPDLKALLRRPEIHRDWQSQMHRQNR